MPISHTANSYGGGAKSAVRAQGVPEIAPLKMTHDGVGSDTTPPFVPKENLILAQTSVPSNPFAGSQYQIEFEIPRHLGKVIDNQLNFQISFTNANSGSVDVAVMPTTFWCDAIEVLYNGNVVERVEREEIHQETVQYLTDPELLKQARRMNIDGETGGLTTFPVPNGTTKKSFWLPLWANVLNSAQPYIRGFDGTWKYRLWLTNNFWATSDGLAPAGITFNLSQMYMYITEAGLQPGVESAVMSAHNQGCVYRTVIRNKWVKTEQSLAAGQEYQQTLTSFNTDSSALNLYVKPQDAYPYQRIQKLQIAAPDSYSSYVQIRDAANGELTIQLQPDEVSVDASLYVPLTSVSTYPWDATTDPFTDLTGLQKFYLFPFCSNLDKVLAEAKVCGGYLLTGQERIVINPDRTLAGALTSPDNYGSGGVQVCVVSYEYTKISVQNRQPSVRRTV